MINEKMLEYLMLERALMQTHNWMNIESDTILIMKERKKYLEDKFINEYKPTRPIIKDPVKDATAKEE